CGARLDSLIEISGTWGGSERTLRTHRQKFRTFIENTDGASGCLGVSRSVPRQGTSYCDVNVRTCGWVKMPRLQRVAFSRGSIHQSTFFQNHSGIAYRFFHFKGFTRVIHGVILTDDEYRLIRRFDIEELGIGVRHRPVSHNVMDFCQQFVCVPQALAA
ncbi:MAG: hypothetical protein Q7S87_06865, partial [Agitococcus sp.]|nr:hypothetical protein [Agitococcus sp.]